MFFALVLVTLDDVLTSLQIEAHVGAVNDLAFSYPNKQTCIVTCGDDKLVKVTDFLFPIYNIF